MSGNTNRISFRVPSWLAERLDEFQAEYNRDVGGATTTMPPVVEDEHGNFVVDETAAADGTPLDSTSAAVRLLLWQALADWARADWEHVLPVQDEQLQCPNDECQEADHHRFIGWHEDYPQDTTDAFPEPTTVQCLTCTHEADHEEFEAAYYLARMEDDERKRLLDQLKTDYTDRYGTDTEPETDTPDPQTNEPNTE